MITYAMSVIHWAVRRRRPPGAWLARMLSRKPRKVVAAAQANRMARIAWALMRTKGVYRQPTPLA